MREFPIFTPASEPAHLACVPRSLLPLFCGQLAALEQPEAWASDEDWRQGYAWIVELQAELMSGCIDKLIQGQERIYRLLDTALNGAVYTAVGVDPVTGLAIVEPAIAAAPAATDPQALTTIALRNRIDRLVDLVDNGLNGTMIPNPPSAQPSLRDNIEAIRALVEAQGANTDEIEGLINTVILALA